MTTQTESESSLNCWAIVEVMGRKSYSGKVSEEKIAGHAFVRVDVPETPGCEPFTKLIGPSSIYCITPVAEEIARSRAKEQGATPVSPWELDPCPMGEPPFGWDNKTPARSELEEDCVLDPHCVQNLIRSRLDSMLETNSRRKSQTVNSVLAAARARRRKACIGRGVHSVPGVRADEKLPQDFTGHSRIPFGVHVQRLLELRDSVVGGERPGDTLKRLSRLIRKVARDRNSPTDDVTDTNDWKSWLHDFGEQLNNA